MAEVNRATSVLKRSVLMLISLLLLSLAIAWLLLYFNGQI